MDPPAWDEQCVACAELEQAALARGQHIGEEYRILTCWRRPVSSSISGVRFGNSEIVGRVWVVRVVLFCSYWLHCISVKSQINKNIHEGHSKRINQQERTNSHRHANFPLLAELGKTWIVWLRWERLITGCWRKETKDCQFVNPQKCLRNQWQAEN